MTDRLPAIDAGMVLELTSLEVYRDQFGMLACAQRGVGPRRKKLGPVTDTPGYQISPEEMARDAARMVLRGMCALCPYKHCKMKTWGMD